MLRILFILIIFTTACTENKTGKNPGQHEKRDFSQFSANAMAPLVMESDAEWQEFEEQITIAKSIGVNAISVDIWWGLVEAKTDNQFDWQYYDKIFAIILKAELHIVPIMSVHRCGGYEGDACNYPVPDWIWTHFESKGMTKSDLMFKGENGVENDEFVSLWQDELIIPQYVEFMDAFNKQYQQHSDKFDEINISLGPSGELRYPAYNPRDERCAYPTRGCFQAYSKQAIQDFQKYAIEKYSNLDAVSEAWSSHANFKSVSEILPPMNSPIEKGYAESFIANNQHLETQYGRDFSEWYHQALVDHGERMIRAAIQSFDGAFSDVPIGVKLAGIHWLMSPRAPRPRATEIAVGTIYASDQLNQRSSGFGYGRLMKMLERVNQDRLVFLHFTNLEGDDSDIVDGRHTYSMAKTQVNYVATAATDNNVPLKGENAMGFGVESHHAWDNIEQSFKRNDFTGITVLRVENITRNKIGKSRMKKFIAQKKQAVDSNE